MSGMAGLSSTQTEPEADSVCYVCLCPASAQRALVKPCKCPHPVHRECLARWQLYQSGRSEEVQCRFCFAPLPDWKPVVLGDETAEGEAAAPKPLMAAVVFNNVVHKIPILPGPEGKAAFKRKVNELFGLSNRMFEVQFEIKVQSDNLSLRGLSAYEAATRCAAMSARRSTATASTSSSQEQQQQEAAEAGPLAFV